MNRIRIAVAILAAASLGLGAAEAQKTGSQKGRKAPARQKPTPPTPDETTKALSAFKMRVDQYLELQRREREKLPPLPDKATPAQVAAHEKELRARLLALRAQAKQGELFGRDVEPVFRWFVAGELKGPGSKPDLKTAAEGNPRGGSEPAAKPVVVKVNGTYEDAPQTTMPPDLLRKLPVLPDALAYRFVGRHLTVRDNFSGLVVDYILDATPPLPPSRH
jgi:hypothetical protein